MVRGIEYRISGSTEKWGYMKMWAYTYNNLSQKVELIANTKCRILSNSMRKCGQKHQNIGRYQDIRGKRKRELTWDICELNLPTDKIQICAKCWPSILIQSKVSVITTTEGQK